MNDSYPGMSQVYRGGDNSAEPNATTAKSATVRTCTAVHQRQIASMTNNSAYTRYATKTTPTVASPSRPYRTRGRWSRHSWGRQATTIGTKNTSPSSATGMPNTVDCSLVVTLVQLTTPVSGQASVLDAVKCSTVR